MLGVSFLSQHLLTLYFDIMMDRILFWVYDTYYRVYEYVLGLMLSDIEYVKVFKIYLP